MKNKLTKYEKETVIIFNQEDDLAEIYTCDEKWIRDLDKLVKKDRRITVVARDEYSKTYNLPKRAVKVRLSRILTESESKKRALQAKRSFHSKK